MKEYLLNLLSGKLPLPLTSNYTKDFIAKFIYKRNLNPHVFQNHKEGDRFNPNCMYRMLLVFKNGINLKLRKSNAIFCKFEFISRNTNNLNFVLTNHKLSILNVDMIICINPLMFVSLDN